jgi:chemotaxis protein CheZ
VLTLVEVAKPQCDDLATRGGDLASSLERMAAAQDLSVDRARALMLTCGKFAASTSKFAGEQSTVLGDIMMAQDFQDLSGQVIKKVIDIITRTEMQLVQLLLDSSPTATEGGAATKPAEFTGQTHELQGPQTAETALKQDDVDDLLSSLGF